MEARASAMRFVQRHTVGRARELVSVTGMPPAYGDGNIGGMCDAAGVKVRSSRLRKGSRSRSGIGRSEVS